MLEILKAIVFGIVEGITEWLPVSSTGHLILLDEFLRLNVSEDFLEMFHVVIQLGAILAVVVLYFGKLNPFGSAKSAEERKQIWGLWAKVAVAVVPSALVGFALDDWMDAHLYNYKVVSVTLIAYGIAFLFLEKGKEKRVIANWCAHWFAMTEESVYAIGWKTAFYIGCFQCLALIPGTSRSGATILGAILLGVARPAGAEFSFFLAIPTMLGASGLKLGKFLLSGVQVGGLELAVLLTGCAVSFLVSVLVIRALMDYVRRHSFFAFGVYRILLGLAVLAYFA